MHLDKWWGVTLNGDERAVKALCELMDINKTLFENLYKVHAQKEEHKNEHKSTYGWQCNDCGYAWTGEDTDFDCPKCEGNNIEEIDSSI